MISGAKVQKHALKPDLDEEDDEDENPVTGLEWDLLSVDYLLVSNSLSGVQLVDSSSITVIMVFQLPSVAAKVKTLAWVPSAPGTFITGGKRSVFMI